MAKVVDLPIGTKIRFPKGTGVYEQTLFYISNIPDDKSWVVVEFADPCDTCIQLSPDFEVVPCHD